MAIQLTTIDLQILEALGLAAALLGFGIWYAVHIAGRRPKQGNTWKEVFVGCGATLIGGCLLQAVWMDLCYSGCIAKLLWLALPALAFGLTGIPMIIGQVVKYDEFERRNRRKRDEFWR